MPAALLLACAVAAGPAPAPDHHLEDEAKPAGIVERVRAAVGEDKADKPFILVVSMTAKKGRAKDLVEAYRGASVKSKSEPGCTAYNLHRDAEDPNKFLLYERWKGTDALASHLEQPYTKEFVGKFGDLLDDSSVAVMRAVPPKAGRPGDDGDSDE